MNLSKLCAVALFCTLWGCGSDAPETPVGLRPSSTDPKLRLRSLQKKIESMLTGFGPIKSASVQIVSGSNEQPSTGTGSDPTASVVCRLKQGQDLSTCQVRSIASVLRGAVKGLKLENTFITEAGTGRHFPVPHD